MSISRHILKPRQYWTEEQVNWLIQNYSMFSTVEELREEYLKLFPYRDYNGIKNKLQWLGLRLVKYTEEEENWLSEHYLEANSWSELADMFNARFHKNKRFDAIEKKCESLGLRVGTRELPVGTVVRKGNGRYYIKTKLTEGKARQKGYDREHYESYALHVYRNHYGEPNDGYRIVHLNMNLADNSIENLYAVSPYVFAGLMREKWFNPNTEITMTAIKQLELMEQVKRGDAI